jgi:hypothetical protein
VQIHGSSAFVTGPGDITVDLNAADPDFVFVKVGFPGGVYMTVYGAGDADMVITKFLQAKDMLAAHRHAVANHAGIGEYVNGTTQATGEADQATHLDNSTADGLPVPAGTCRAGAISHSWLCTRLPGHDGDHYTVTGNGAVKWPAVAEGLPVAEDDGGDGDDTREPYCTTCLFTLDAAGEHHLYPDDAIVAAHEIVLGWREPVGREIHGVQAYVNTAEDAQAAEVRRIGKLHTDGHITDAECKQLTDKALGLGEHA